MDAARAATSIMENTEPRRVTIGQVRTGKILQRFAPPETAMPLRPPALDPTHTRAQHRLGLSGALPLPRPAAREAAAGPGTGTQAARREPHDPATRQGILDAALAHARGRVRVRARGRGRAAHRCRRAIAARGLLRGLSGRQRRRPPADQSLRPARRVPRGRHERRGGRGVLPGRGHALRPGRAAAASSRARTEPRTSSIASAA